MFCIGRCATVTVNTKVGDNAGPQLLAEILPLEDSMKALVTAKTNTNDLAGAQEKKAQPPLSRRLKDEQSARCHKRRFDYPNKELLRQPVNDCLPKIRAQDHGRPETDTSGNCVHG